MLSKNCGFQNGHQINIAYMKDTLCDDQSIKCAKEIFNSLLYYTKKKELDIKDKGRKVVIIQDFLGITTTGKFDKYTYNAVVELQNKLNLIPDGIFDSKIIEAINVYIDKFGNIELLSCGSGPESAVNINQLYQYATVQVAGAFLSDN
jgi:peptidoglycan hydrolase-like protein with peptidoglycan-binding domain